MKTGKASLPEETAKLLMAAAMPHTLIEGEGELVTVNRRTIPSPQSAPTSKL